MNWWDYIITQAFNPPVEPGVDIGTPFHTAITAIEPGKVIGETFGGFGARVDVLTPSGVDSYYQHLDQIAPGLKVGSPVSIGQLLGLSGGQLAGGYLPNNPANSSGPHIEFGLLKAGQSIDPTGTVKQIATMGAGPPILPGDRGTSTTPGAGSAPFDPFGINAAVTNLGHGIADFAVVGEHNTADWLGRQAIAFFVAAVVLLVLFGNSNK